MRTLVTANVDGAQPRLCGEAFDPPPLDRAKGRRHVAGEARRTNGLEGAGRVRPDVVVGAGAKRPMKSATHARGGRNDDDKWQGVLADVGQQFWRFVIRHPGIGQHRVDRA